MSELECDENGMVVVYAARDGVRDNGHTYAKGQMFHMHRALVPAHVASGQVQLEPLNTQAKAPRTKSPA